LLALTLVVVVQVMLWRQPDGQSAGGRPLALLAAEGSGGHRRHDLGGHAIPGFLREWPASRDALAGKAAYHDEILLLGATTAADGAKADDAGPFFANPWRPWPASSGPGQQLRTYAVSSSWCAPRLGMQEKITLHCIAHACMNACDS
jgi:hypothetical protein